jgi:uncharacterized small protein (DUF1192 family)
MAELQKQVKKMQSLDERIATLQARLDRLEAGTKPLKSQN